MRGKLTVIGLLLGFLALMGLSQLPVVPFTVPVASTGSQSPIPFFPNLAEYWEFTSTSLTTNAAVSNWIGAIQGIILTNGATTLRPTNSSSGVGFSGTKYLTNLPFAVGSNATITMFYQYTGNSLGTGPGTLWGSNNAANANAHAWLQTLESASANQTMNTYDDSLLITGPSTPIPNFFEDFVYSPSNNANSGGATFAWTNGVLLYNKPTHDIRFESLTFIGSCIHGPAGPGLFVGWIQALYIQTNFIANGVNASNVHYYRTNYLTPGASP